jgi:hypothetical protein
MRLTALTSHEASEQGRERGVFFLSLLISSERRNTPLMLRGGWVVFCWLTPRSAVRERMGAVPLRLGVVYVARVLQCGQTQRNRNKRPTRVERERERNLNAVVVGDLGWEER